MLNNNQISDKLKVLELFGGIGAITKSLTNIGVDFEVVDYVEIDDYAVNSYNAMYGTNFQPQDICDWNKSIEVDFVAHGSPCQDFSIGGTGAGGDEGSHTRSSLMYETIRIIEKVKPKVVLWENVRNLLGNKHYHNFCKYIDRLKALGYKSDCRILNASDFDVPQYRERVFVVSIREDIENDFCFPAGTPTKKTVKDILEKDFNDDFRLVRKAKYYKPKTNKGCLQIAQMYGTEKNPNPQAGRIYSLDGLSPTMSTSVGGNMMPKFAINNSIDENGEIIIRRLSPKECWRLMGFDDSDYEKASKVNSKQQLYKQAGNSIVVTILNEILTNLFK